MSFRYWRPAVNGRRALLVGVTKEQARFCHNYRIVGRIAMPVTNEERRRPLATCTLNHNLAALWPKILRLYN